MPLFKNLVDEEKARAREGNGPFNSMHEIYGVLMEEVDEFFDQVKTKPSERDPDNTLGELVQIAAVAEMAAEDLQLVQQTQDGREPIEISLLEDVREFVENSTIITLPSIQKREHESATYAIVVPLAKFHNLQSWLT